MITPGTAALRQRADRAWLASAFEGGRLDAAGAVACAGRDGGLVYAVVRQRFTYKLARLVHRGLLRLGVKQLASQAMLGSEMYG